MRLAATAKGGFYPAAPEAVAEALKYLKPGWKNGHASILDPCAGEGAALAQIARAFKIDRHTPEGYGAFAIELDEERGKKVKAAVPFAITLTPADAFGVATNYSSFNFIWLNPPYDDEMGGGNRVEHKFLQYWMPFLRPGGVLCLVVPERIVSPFSPTHRVLLESFERVSMMPFPESCRRFKEVVVFAVRREGAPVPARWDDQQRYFREPSLDSPYTIPTARNISYFRKVEPTEWELARMFAESPLQQLLRVPKPVPLRRPPLPLNRGHVAMLLASGHLDGVVHPEGEEPHVVRGVADKETYLASEEETENADGDTTVKQIFSQKIVLVVRAVDRQGNLKTFAEAGKEKVDEPESE